MKDTLVRPDQGPRNSRMDSLKALMGVTGLITLLLACKVSGSIGKNQYPKPEPKRITVEEGDVIEGCGVRVETIFERQVALRREPNGNLLNDVAGVVNTTIVGPGSADINGCKDIGVVMAGRTQPGADALAILEYLPPSD